MAKTKKPEIICIQHGLLYVTPNLRYWIGPECESNRVPGKPREYLVCEILNSCDLDWWGSGCCTPSVPPTRRRGLAYARKVIVGAEQIYVGRRYKISEIKPVDRLECFMFGIGAVQRLKELGPTGYKQLRDVCVRRARIKASDFDRVMRHYGVIE